MKKIKGLTIIIALIMIMEIIFASANIYAANEVENETANQVENEVGSDEFLNAKIELKGELSHSQLEISNITLESEYYYYYKITNTNTKPAISSKNDFFAENSEWSRFSEYPNENKLIIYSSKMNRYLELADDMYLWVYKVPYATNNNNYYELISGHQIEHLTIPTTPELFFVTTFTHDWTNINLICPWSYNDTGTGTERKINVKIGKISDNNILNSIKNTESDCFSKLLTYSKNAESIYKETLTSNDYNGYNSSKGGKVVDLYSKINNNQYYYMYVQLDDENGKYYPVEGVTLAKSSKYGADQNNSWYLFFYGDKDFDWSGFNGGSQSGDDGKKEDPTVAKDPIPQTGQSLAVAGGIVATLIISFILIRKIIKYKGI